MSNVTWGPAASPIKANATVKRVADNAANRAELLTQAGKDGLPSAVVDFGGEIGLAFPTRIQLGWLAEHATSGDALTAYRGRSVEPLIPEVIGEGEEARVVLPGIADSRNLKNLVEEFRRD